MHRTRRRLAGLPVLAWQLSSQGGGNFQTNDSRLKIARDNLALTVLNLPSSPVRCRRCSFFFLVFLSMQILEGPLRERAAAGKASRASKLIRTCFLLGPYNRTMPRALRWS